MNDSVPSRVENRGDMAGKLTQLDIGETSGVDHPAHLAEGWMLMKSKDGAFAARVAELLKDSTKECQSCGAAVPNGDAYCPECGNKADGGDMEKAGSLDRLRTLHKAIGELISEGGEMSDDAVKETEVTDDEMLKSVPPAVRDLILKERAERETLATELAKERELRATEEAIAKAAGWSGLGIDATEFGPSLAKLRTLDAELAKSFEDVLDGAHTVVETSNLFKSVGRDAPAEGSAQGKLDALTKEYMAKSTDVDYATAQAAVLESPEGAALYDAVAQAAMKGE